MIELKKKWYVVRAISGQEAKVKLYIEKEIQHLGMQDFVSQILVSDRLTSTLLVPSVIKSVNNRNPGKLFEYP